MASAARVRHGKCSEGKGRAGKAWQVQRGPCAGADEWQVVHAERSEGTVQGAAQGTYRAGRSTGHTQSAADGACTVQQMAHAAYSRLGPYEDEAGGPGLSLRKMGIEGCGKRQAHTGEVAC